MFFALNRVFQSLFLKKRKSWVLVSAGCMRERSLGRGKAIGYHGGQSSANPKNVRILIPRTYEHVTLHDT